MPRKKVEVDQNQKLTAYTVYTAKDEIDRNFGEVRLYTANWDSRGRRLKYYFDNHHVQYSYHDINNSENYKAVMDAAKKHGIKEEDIELPYVVMPTKDAFNPSIKEIEETLLIEDTQARELFDVVVVGGGVSGYYAALDCARLGYKTILLERNVLLGTLAALPTVHSLSSRGDLIEGDELANMLREQIDAESDVVVVEGVFAKRLKTLGNLLEISTDGAIYRTKSVILATGAEYSILSLPGELEFFNRGIYYDIDANIARSKGKDVIIAGVGNPLLLNALKLSEYAGHVTAINIGKKIDADILIKNRLKKSNVTFVESGKVMEFRGNITLEAIKYVNNDNSRTYIIEAGAAFITLPNKYDNRWLSNVLELDERGRVLSKNYSTQMKGVFITGDAKTGKNSAFTFSRLQGAIGSQKVQEFLEKWDENHGVNHF